MAVCAVVCAADPEAAAALLFDSVIWWDAEMTLWACARQWPATDKW